MPPMHTNKVRFLQLWWLWQYLMFPLEIKFNLVGWGQKETLKSTKFTIILNWRNPNWFHLYTWKRTDSYNYDNYGNIWFSIRKKIQLRLAAGRGGYGKGRPPTSRDAKIGRLNDRRTPPRGMYPDATLAPSRRLACLLACYKAPSSWIRSCVNWFPTRSWKFFFVVKARRFGSLWSIEHNLQQKNW